MTNEEAIRILKDITWNSNGRYEITDMLDTRNLSIQALQENDKLKAEIEQFSNELISVRIENELLRKKNELTNYYFEQYAAAIDEIEQLKEEVLANKKWSDVVERTLKKEIDKNEMLKSELEQSVKLPLTQADKIRSMSDEELTKNIMSNIGCSCCEKMTGDCGLKKGISCKDWMMKWLKSEVSDGN